ncbi:MAG: nucleotidyltransferase family protein [Bacteroidota bacterium]
MKAMILAAGKGTRLQPLTNKIPKALVEIHGKPLLDIIISKLKNNGFTDVIVNVHHFADKIINYIEHTDFGINIEISDERDQLLDTGGGILKAKWFFKGTDAFLVYNVDILSDINLYDLYEAHVNSNALVTMAVKQRQTSRQLLFDSEGNLCQWKNIETGEIKNARTAFGELNPLAFSGIHVLDTKIFDHFTEKGKFSIIDTYLRLAKKFVIRSYIHNYSKWFDMGRYQYVQEFNKNGNMKGLF